FGEISTLMNDMYQWFNFRGRDQLKPYYDLIANAARDREEAVRLKSDEASARGRPRLQPRPRARPPVSEEPAVDAPPAHLIEREQWIARPIEEVFAFYSDPTNLEAITPQWLHFSVIATPPIAMAAGTVIEYRLRWHVVPLRWTTLIEDWEPPHRFVDMQ